MQHGRMAEKRTLSVNALPGKHGQYVGSRITEGHAPVVAEWVGLPSLNLASASAGEFLTGE